MIKIGQDLRHAAQMESIRGELTLGKMTRRVKVLEKMGVDIPKKQDGTIVGPQGTTGLPGLLIDYEGYIARLRDKLSPEQAKKFDKICNNPIRLIWALCKKDI